MRQNESVSDDRCELLCLDLDTAEALRRGRLPDARAGELARAGRALGDSTRVTIAAALSETDELCVCDLAWVTERSIQAVSHHLGVLRAAGLAVSRRDGKVVFYALTALGRELIDAHLVAIEGRA